MDILVEQYISFLNEEEQQILIEGRLMDLTKEQINKLISAATNNMKLVNKFLSDHGVSVSYIQSEGKKLSKYVESAFKNNVSQKDAAKEISKRGQKVLQKSLEKTDSKDIGIKILKSLGVFIIVGFINGFLVGFATPLFGAKIAGILLALVIAPIVEEFAKRNAVLKNYPFIYTSIFAGLEFINYIMMWFNGALPNWDLPFFIIMRVITFIMHLTTTVVQKYFYDKEKQQGVSDENISKTGYYAGVAIHSFYNLMGVLGDSTLASISKSF